MASQFEHLVVTEIIRQTDSGMTEPFLCRLSDEQQYAVKGAGAQPKGLMAEVFAASVGQSIGLPIPPFVLANDAENLLAEGASAAARRSLGEDPLFASLWQEPTEVFGTPMLSSVSPYLRAEIYVFDHWIMNSDRTLSEHGGNPNLLMHLANQKVVVIDHNLAFDPNHKIGDLDQHVFRRSWEGVRRDSSFKKGLETRMIKALKVVAAFDAMLPQEWLDAEPGFCESTQAALERVKGNAFWSELG